MTAVWFGPDEVDEALESCSRSLKLLLVRLLEVAALLLVTVLEVPAPPPSRSTRRLRRQ